MRGIGRLARESGLSVSALRFYDGAGVLVPAHVDPHSGYRWYSAEQVLTARLIARLRRVGMPLAEIGRVLANAGDRPVVAQLLQAHLQRLEDGLADARRELSTVLSLLDQENPMTATRITTTTAELAPALRAVRHAVGTDPELPVLTGVLLDLTDGALQLAATDRYRLAVCTVPGAVVDGPLRSVIAPAALVDEVLAVVTGVTDAVTVDLDGDDIAVTVAGCRLTGARLDADFPDHRRVLRTGSAHRLDVDVAALRAGLAAAPVRSIRRETDGAPREVSVLSLTDDGALGFGEGAAGLSVGLDREFLLQALEATGAGQLVLELDGPLTPLVLRDPRHSGHVSLLMPVRLS